MTLLELVLLISLLVISFSIVWGTLKTGISPMMSSGKACQAMLALIKADVNAVFIDLGSGWGTLVIALARKYPNQQVIGYELSLFPWLVSVILKRALGLDNLTVYRQDFQKADLGNRAILFCYLFPRGMIELDKKLKRECLTNTLIVSNTFALPSCQPVEIIKLDDLYQTPIYLYRWQAK